MLSKCTAGNSAIFSRYVPIHWWYLRETVLLKRSAVLLLQEISISCPNLAGLFCSSLHIVKYSFAFISTLNVFHSISNTENKQENFQSKEGKEGRSINTAKRYKVSKQREASERLSKLDNVQIHKPQEVIGDYGHILKNKKCNFTVRRKR